MKKFKDYFMRIWVSALAGMGFGFFISLVGAMFTNKDINGLIMLLLIIGGAVGAWFILSNNNDFKK